MKLLFLCFLITIIKAYSIKDKYCGELNCFQILRLHKFSFTIKQLGMQLHKKSKNHFANYHENFTLIKARSEEKIPTPFISKWYKPMKFSTRKKPDKPISITCLIQIKTRFTTITDIINKFTCLRRIPLLFWQE
jgi:hypothetical protein